MYRTSEILATASGYSPDTITLVEMSGKWSHSTPREGVAIPETSGLVSTQSFYN